MNMYNSQAQQMELLKVKEDKKHIPAKRVDIVSLRMVKEASLLYKDRTIRSPEDGYNLFKQFLGELDREYFIAIYLNVKKNSKLHIYHPHRQLECKYRSSKRSYENSDSIKFCIYNSCPQSSLWKSQS